MRPACHENYCSCGVFLKGEESAPEESVNRIVVGFELLAEIALFLRQPFAINGVLWRCYVCLRFNNRVPGFCDSTT